MYAIRVFKSHGLPAAEPHTVTKATTIAPLLYASPTWRGLTTEKDRARLNKLFTRMKRTDYLPHNGPLFHNCLLRRCGLSSRFFRGYIVTEHLLIVHEKQQC